MPLALDSILHPHVLKQATLVAIKLHNITRRLDGMPTEKRQLSSSA